MPLPGTVLRQRLEAEGRLFPRYLVDWDKYDGNWVCFQPDEGCSAKDLQNYATWIMRKVYHPWQIAKLLCLIPYYPIDFALNAGVETLRGIKRYFKQNPISTLPHRSIRYHARTAMHVAGTALSNAQKAVSKRLRNARLKSAGSLIYESWKRNFRKERFYEVLDAASRHVKTASARPSRLKEGKSGNR